MLRLPIPRGLAGLILIPLSLSCIDAALTAQRFGTGRSRKTVAIKVGTLHPVSAPEISNGIILIRGSRIVAVGPADEIKVPENAELLDYSQAHAYPGLVDALSTAYADAATFSGSADAATRILDGLDRYDHNSRSVIESGVTTAYVGNNASGTWGGQGTAIRPMGDHFGVLAGQRETAALQMNVATSSAATHALIRQKALRAIGKPFTSLDAYEKSKTDHAKKLTEYKKKFAEYLDYHRKKKGGSPKAQPATPQPATPPAQGNAQDPRQRFGRGRGSRGGRPGERPTPPKPGEEPKPKPGEEPKPKPGEEPKPKPGEEPKPKPGEEPKPKPGEEPKPKPGEEPKPSGNPTPQSGEKPKAPGSAQGQKAAATKPGEQAPKRPKHPGAFREDPVKEALLKVRKGDLPLRVKAQRADEIRAVLRMAREAKLPKLILESLLTGSGMIEEIAESGTPVVLTDLLPEPGPSSLQRKDPRLAAELSEAGIAVAIGSGSASSSRHLTLLAAYAVGFGMSPDAAVAAITLTPAKILGLSKQVGSLDQGKLADILLTSGPILSSDTHILRVISAGSTQFEAK